MVEPLGRDTSRDTMTYASVIEISEYTKGVPQLAHCPCTSQFWERAIPPHMFYLNLFLALHNLQICELGAKKHNSNVKAVAWHHKHREGLCDRQEKVFKCVFVHLLCYVGEDESRMGGS